MNNPVKSCAILCIMSIEERYMTDEIGKKKVVSVDSDVAVTSTRFLTFPAYEYEASKIC